MTREISYNLPGYGFAKCLLFGQAVELYDFLEAKGLLEKMKNTYQLGTMRYVYPGAHHTRYEYVFTQLLLISNVTMAKGIGERDIELSVSSNLGEYEKDDIRISGAALMQCLALLSNAGHMYDTFTSSRIITELLQQSKNEKTEFYTIYKRNLPREIHSKFDNYLNDSNYYKLHLFNMIHLLSGYSNSSADKKMCLFFIRLLTQLIDSNLIKTLSVSRIFYLYRKIRKIAYLSVDMVYTPASFGANLSRMVYSIPSFIDELFDEDSVMNQSIKQLEDIIHKQIYDSSMCILNSSRIIFEKMSDYTKIINQAHNIFDIRKIILENDSPYNTLHSTIPPKIIKDLEAKNTLLFTGLTNTEHHKDLHFQRKISMSLPSTRITFGAQISQNMERTYAAFGLIPKSKVFQDSQIIISTAIKNNVYSNEEKHLLIKHAISSIYPYGDYYFTLHAPQGFDINQCTIITRGCRNAEAYIRNHFSKECISDSDQLHEITSCANVLHEIDYSGLVVCFVGGIKASKYSSTNVSDEIDGLIYFPNRGPEKCFAIVIEAKNYLHGKTDAEKQLHDTMKLLCPELSGNIKTIPKCAYLEISER